MAKITADTLIADCLELNPNAAEILLEIGRASCRERV